MVLAGLVPVVGSYLTMAYLGNLRRFAVLTDARLLLFDPRRDPSVVKHRGTVLDVPLHAVWVSRTRKARRYRVRIPVWPSVTDVQVEKSKSKVTARLVDGFDLLASEGDSRVELIAE